MTVFEGSVESVSVMFFVDLNLIDLTYGLMVMNFITSFALSRSESGENISSFKFKSLLIACFGFD